MFPFQSQMRPLGDWQQHASPNHVEQCHGDQKSSCRRQLCLFLAALQDGHVLVIDVEYFQVSGENDIGRETKYNNEDK
jgi:hypothetical protein